MPSARAIRARRSQPAQDIVAENVCTLVLPAQFPRTRHRAGRRVPPPDRPAAPVAQTGPASPRLHQPVIEKQLGRRQHNGAIDIVLDLLCSLVAHAHRTHAEEAFERTDHFLFMSLPPPMA